VAPFSCTAATSSQPSWFQSTRRGKCSVPVLTAHWNWVPPNAPEPLGVAMPAPYSTTMFGLPMPEVLARVTTRSSRPSPSTSPRATPVVFQATPSDQTFDTAG